MKNLNKKIITIVFILLILVPSIIFIPTNQAEAITPKEALGGGVTAAIFCSGVMEKLGGLIQGLIGSLISAEVPTAENSNRTKESCLDYMAYLTANILIEEALRETVNWINGTSDGAPKFATNITGFLTDIVDNTIGEFLLTELPLVCSPFRLSVELSIRQRYIPERYYQCTLGDVFNNIEDFTEFLDGDFFKGGWSGWLELTQRNSPYQTISSIENTINSRIQGRQNIELAKLSWGSGFFEWKTCPDEAYVCIGDSFAETKEECEETTDMWQCTNPLKTNTPGSVIEDQLNLMLGSGERRLEFADELNEVVTALLNKLLTDVLTNPKGLLGYDTEARVGSESYYDGDGGTNMCDMYGICGGDDGGGGIPPIPPGASCIFFASNGGDYCDEDEDFDDVITAGGQAQFILTTGTGGTWFITPYQDMIDSPPEGGWANSLNPDGHPRCQAYGNFGNNPPFPITMTWQDSDNGGIYSIPVSSNGHYTLGVYGGSGASNEAWLCTDSGGGGGGGGEQPNFNSSFFINDIENVSAVRNSLDFRTKKKMERGGSAWWNSSGFHVRWEEVPAWTPVTAGAPPFGQLHIVGYIPSEDLWYDWDIENLERSDENLGTDSVDIDSVGSKPNSPDSSFQLRSGDWFGLYIATYSGGLSVRSDILPVKYVGGGGGNGSGLGNDIPSPPSIDLNEVVWIDENVSSWAQTATLSSVTFPNHGWIRLDYDKANVWPEMGASGVEGVANAWIFVYRKNKWYGGTWEYMRPGQKDKLTENLEGGRVLGKLESEKELINFYPQSGDEYYFMMSGTARAGTPINIRERSNLLRVRWL